MKKFIIGIFCVIAMLSCLFITSCKNNRQESNIGVCDSDSVIQEPTIKDILKEREDVKHQAYVDSVYLNMPMPILIQILQTYGTTLTFEDIVNKYTIHKQMYDANYNQINKVQQYMTNPDSLPKKAYPEQRADTIVKIIKGN